MTARLHYPDTRLTALLARPHGRPRAEAVLGGARSLEAQRGNVMAALEGLIAGLETGAQSQDRLPDIARDADRIVTLALLFGLTPLAGAAQRLCDMTALLARRNCFDAAPLEVHIKALRLFAPDSPILGDAEAALVLGRIAALAAHVTAHLSGR